MKARPTEGLASKAHGGPGDLGLKGQWFGVPDLVPERRLPQTLRLRNLTQKSPFLSFTAKHSSYPHPGGDTDAWVGRSLWCDYPEVGGGQQLGSSLSSLCTEGSLPRSSITCREGERRPPMAAGALRGETLLPGPPSHDYSTRGHWTSVTLGLRLPGKSFQGSESMRRLYRLILMGS